MRMLLPFLLQFQTEAIQYIQGPRCLSKGKVRMAKELSICMILTLPICSLARLFQDPPKNIIF